MLNKKILRVEDYMLTNESDKVILDADGNPIPNMTESDVLANDLKNSNLNGECDGNFLRQN